MLLPKERNGRSRTPPLLTLEKVQREQAKAAKDSADMARKRLPEEVMNPSKPITSVSDNYELAKAYQSTNGNGMFGIKGENCRIYKSSDQYESAADFYARISRGGKETVFGGNKGLMSEFDDGSRVMYRVITSTKNSPAIEIQLLSKPFRDVHFLVSFRDEFVGEGLCSSRKNETGGVEPRPYFGNALEGK